MYNILIVKYLKNKYFKNRYWRANLIYLQTSLQNYFNNIGGYDVVIV